jgi:hypothetical protein
MNSQKNQFFKSKMFGTVCFTDLDQGSEILNRFSLPNSIKHTVGLTPVSTIFLLLISVA